MVRVHLLVRHLAACLLLGLALLIGMTMPLPGYGQPGGSGTDYASKCISDKCKGYSANGCNFNSLNVGATCVTPRDGPCTWSFEIFGGVLCVGTDSSFNYCEVLIAGCDTGP